MSEMMRTVHRQAGVCEGMVLVLAACAETAEEASLLLLSSQCCEGAVPEKLYLQILRTARALHVMYRSVRSVTLERCGRGPDVYCTLSPAIIVGF